MRKKGKYDQAIKSINQSLQIFLKMGNSIKQLFPIFIELSSAHLLNGNYFIFFNSFYFNFFFF